MRVPSGFTNLYCYAVELIGYPMRDFVARGRALYIEERATLREAEEIA